MRILIYGGWFGSRNLGDEALLKGVISLLQRRLPDAELLVLSTDPEYTMSQSGVLSEMIHSPRTLLNHREEYLSLFSDSDVHLLTGGTPFYDYGHLSRVIHMSLPAINRRKVVCFGVGCKPIKSLMGREITRVVLRNASVISTRDNISKQILQPLTGRLRKPITVTGDSAHALKPEKSRLDKNRIIFVPRRLTRSHKLLYHQRLTQAEINRIRHMQARAADRLIEQGYSVSFTPFHCVPPDDDREEIRVINNLMHNEPDITPRPPCVKEALRLIGGASLLVGLRLHSLILASIQRTPFVSVDYDIKIRGYMEHMMNQQYLTGLNDGLDMLYRKSMEAIENSPSISPLLTRRVTTVRGLINAEADSIISLIEKQSIGHNTF